MSIFKKIASIFLAFAAAVLLASCAGTGTAGTTSSEELKKPEELTVFLHAGGGMDGLTYMNAQETFEYYYAKGYRYFEYDLRLSSDGRLIATHEWEHLDVSDTDITYAEFKELKLSNGFTPANEQWLMETIMSHPDVKIIVDAKMGSDEGDAAVLECLEALEGIYGFDISANIIPEIFSIEMWNRVKDTTSFDKYLFSHYKVYYTVDMMLGYFSDERIWGVAMSNYTGEEIASQLYRRKETKNMFFFTPETEEEVYAAIKMGADGVYLDFPEIIGA
jgi:glycerophosphoryl diester phosphodiesterase